MTDFDPDTGEVLSGRTLEQHANGNSEMPKIGELRTQLSLDVGGHEPSISLMKFTGSLPLGGEYEKGDLVRFVVTARIGSVTFKDVEDKHGYIVGTERVHSAKLHGGGPA